MKIQITYRQEFFVGGLPLSLTEGKEYTWHHFLLLLVDLGEIHAKNGQEEKEKRETIEQNETQIL